MTPAAFPTHTHLRPLQLFHITHVVALGARADGPAQRTLHVGARELVSCIVARGFGLAEVCDEAFGQAEGDVELLVRRVGFEAGGEGAGADGFGDEVGVGEAEVFLGEVEGCGEVFCVVLLVAVAQWVDCWGKWCTWDVAYP